MLVKVHHHLLLEKLPHDWLKITANYYGEITINNNVGNCYDTCNITQQFSVIRLLVMVCCMHAGHILHDQFRIIYML